MCNYSDLQLLHWQWASGSGRTAAPARAELRQADLRFCIVITEAWSYFELQVRVRYGKYH